jgi:carboxypeptidase family protein
VGLAALLLAACCFSIGAQEQRGPSPVSRTIEGSVVDRAGKPVAGAVVLIEDLKSLQVRSYIVQEDGKFRFRGLSSDANYQLRARLNGMVSKPKTVSVFESKTAIVVNLTLAAVKARRAAPPPTATKNPPGNPL